MKEEEIIETFEHWIEYEKANKDRINKADELIEIQQGLLNLYEKEKEKNKMLKELYDDACICIAKDCIEKDKIREKINELEKFKNENVKPYTDVWYKIEGMIQVLQEMLEEE